MMRETLFSGAPGPIVKRLGITATPPPANSTQET